MKSTYRILFLIRKRDLNKEGLANVMVRITISGEQAEFSAKEFVKPEMWSPLGKVIGRTKEAQKINDSLDKIKIALDSHYKAILEREDYVHLINYETPIWAKRFGIILYYLSMILK
ncbi:MAG: hypothetical protein LBV71_14080 [Prevotella sp.]|jgi:hypothetical protein|nr:hypothetical protein [Prevotella sp.]